MKVTMSEDSLILFAFYAPGNQGIQITRSIIFLIFGNRECAAGREKRGKRRQMCPVDEKSLGNFFS